MCSMSSLRKTVQFNNSFVELILAVCDHYHDPTSSPACSSNVADLFPLAPHPFTIKDNFTFGFSVCVCGCQTFDFGNGKGQEV